MGDEKHTVDVEVGCFDVDQYLYEDLSAVMEWLELLKAEDIPPEHLDTAKFYVTEFYDTFTLHVEYKRPETKDEEHDRRVSESNIAAKAEQQERTIYERLKAKFEKDEGG